MLVLTRRYDEAVVFSIGGRTIGRMIISEIRRDRCLIAFDFDKEVLILREELVGKEEASKVAAAPTLSVTESPSLPKGLLYINPKLLEKP